MIYFFSLLLPILLIDLIHRWYLIITKRKEFHLFVTPAFICCLSSIIVSAVIFYTKNERAAYIAMSINFIILDAMVYSVYQFTKSYVQAKQNIWYVRYFLLILLTVDLVLLILNIFNHNYFELSYQTITKLSWNYWRINVKRLMIFHYLICGIIILFTEVFLIHKIRNIPSFYRKKYSWFILFYFLITTLSYCSNIFHLPQDFAIYFYPLMENVVFYYSLFFADSIIRYMAHKSLIDKSSKAVCFFDRQNAFVYMNSSAEALLEKINFNKNAIEHFLKDFIIKNSARTLDITQNEEIIEVDNKKYYLEITYKKAYEGDMLVGSFLEIIDRTQEELKAIYDQQVSSYDKLTGLYNKNTFFERCQERLAEEPDEQWLIMVSKIIDFKVINNLFGKETCDNILKLQADFIKNNAHSSSIAGHIYADNFAILMKKQYFNEEFYISKLLEISQLTNNFYYYMNIYIGVYEKSDVSENVQYMYDKAILAIDKRPENSVKRICHYSNSIMKNFLSERNFISDFNFALNSSQFVIYLQPVFHKYPNLIGAQTIVRWNKPESGLLSPEDFMAIFEHTEIIHKLDLYLWGKSVQQLVRWHKMGRDDLCISVTITAYDFDYINIAAVFENYQHQYELIPANLKICIEEKAFIAHPQKTAEVIQKLHALGYGIEISGFGGRNFSFEMLTKNDVDFIRIDLRNFDSLNDSEMSFSIFSSFIQFSHEMGFDIIVDGIENEKQHKLVIGSGCEVLQGDFYCKPLSRFDFERKYL